MSVDAVSICFFFILSTASYLLPSQLLLTVMDKKLILISHSAVFGLGS